jgi:hypothetical protein
MSVERELRISRKAGFFVRSVTVEGVGPEGMTGWREKSSGRAINRLVIDINIIF